MTAAIARPAALAIALSLAVGLSACEREVRIGRAKGPDTVGVVKAVTKLECPRTEGVLTLVSAAPDGRTCAYRTAAGDEVSLRLTPIAGLDAIETELRGLIPAPPPPAQPAIPPAAGEQDADDEGDAHIRLPGLTIDAGEERARIELGGLHISDNGHGSADIRVSGRNGDGISIVANDDRAEIRQTRDGQGGVRRSVILANNKPAPGAYRVAGYEARGTAAGPVVVAVVRSKVEHQSDNLFDDMKALVELNAGG